jgi:hypothetical protein
MSPKIEEFIITIPIAIIKRPKPSNCHKLGYKITEKIEIIIPSKINEIPIMFNLKKPKVLINHSEVKNVIKKDIKFISAKSKIKEIVGNLIFK